MAKSFKARYVAAMRALDLAQDAVYAAAYPRRDVVFSQCLRMATQGERDAYAAACATRDTLDYEARNSGKAYQARESARHEYFMAQA